MRYSIMLQLVSVITLILLGTAALFAWLQSRREPFEHDSNRSALSTRLDRSIC